MPSLKMVGYEMDFDGNFINDYKPVVKPPTRGEEEINRRGDFAGYKTVDYDYQSFRKTGIWNGMVAPFVDSEDVLPFQLLYSLQRKKPWRQFGGYKLLDLVLSNEVMVWAKDDEAIICFVGQNIAKDSAHLIDDLNVAGATTNEACQLRLARIGKEIIDQVYLKYPYITICGYSLGGTTVGCLATNEKVDRGIIFNGGAPPSNASRPTPFNCTVYHIVGDILSTHFIECNRIYLVESERRRDQTPQTLQTDGIQWYDIAYYHDLDRFLDYGIPWELVTPQFEQNSLENYFFFKSGEASDILGTVAGIASVHFNFRRKIQLQICQNPIPGALSSRGCAEGGPDLSDKIIGGVLGAGAGGIAAALGTAGTAVVPAAAAGAATGMALATGEKGILDVINPDLGKAAVDLGEKFVQGASALDSINTNKGKFTGTIVGDEDRNVFGSTQGLVVKPKF